MDRSFDAFRQAVADEDRRRAVLFRDGRPWFVLLSHQFERPDLEALCATATSIRRMDRHRDGVDFLRGILAGKRVMNLFAQPSTRTCESFVAAAEKLGASARVVSDLRTSSFAKGESVEDAVRTLSSFYDTLVTRHPDEEFATRASWALSRSGRPIPVISAGSGTAEHPTQALLDVYTLEYSFLARGGIDGKRILLVGDIGRNRAARSLALLLTRFRIDRIDIACHPEHPPDAPFVDALARHGIALAYHPSVAEALGAVGKDLDAIYVTRLQQEWDAADAALGTSDAFVLDPALRDRIRPDCVILHPLPRVNELPDAWEDHPGFVVWRQVRNGMWMRAAVLAHVHGAAAEITARADRLGLLGPPPADGARPRARR
ncbi:MAG: aspartate carbamoyltransferase [Myxococcota bacterium]